MEMMKIVLLAIVALSSGGLATTSTSTVLQEVLKLERKHADRIETIEKSLQMLTYAVENSGIGKVNLALKKPAKQISTYEKDEDIGYAKNAVDGSMNISWWGKSCSGTKLEEINPWWEVNLGKMVHFSRVVIKNRGDCCGARLFNFDVKVKGDKTGDEWQTVANYPGMSKTGEILTITFDMAFAQELRIQVNGKTLLTLCEVQVFLK